MHAEDCGGARVAGASFTASAFDTAGGTRGFYTLNGIPSPTASMTDASGDGGFINLPQGFTTIAATQASTGRKIGQSNVIVRAGFITYASVKPTL